MSGRILGNVSADFGLRSAGFGLAQDSAPPETGSNHYARENYYAREEKSALRRLFSDVYDALPGEMSAKTKSTLANGTADLLKTAALFYRTPMGAISYTALSAFDQSSNTNSATQFAFEMGLGAVKGMLTYKAVDTIGDLKFNPIASGVMLGVASQTLDMGLTTSTYRGADGHYSLGTGLKRIGTTVLDPHALMSNAIVYGIGYGAFSGVNTLSAGALNNSPFLRTVLSASSMGAASGAAAEVERQRAERSDIKITDVGIAALKHGLFNAVAAAPGGFRADPFLRERVRNYYDSPGENNMRIRGFVSGNQDGQELIVDKKSELAGTYNMAKESVVRISTGLGRGSGWIVTENGGVVTNAHVVGANKTVRVQMADGSTYKADVRVVDIEKDVAVLKITNGDRAFKPLPMATTATPGETIVTAGYPYGTDVINLSSGQVAGVSNETFFIKQPQTTDYHTSTYTENKFRAIYQARPTLRQPGTDLITALDTSGQYVVFKEVSVPMLRSTNNAQAGNSGGPQLNARGEVVGFVSLGHHSSTLSVIPQSLVDAMRKN